MQDSSSEDDSNKEMRESEIDTAVGRVLAVRIEGQDDPIGFVRVARGQTFTLSSIRQKMILELDCLPVRVLCISRCTRISRCLN